MYVSIQDDLLALHALGLLKPLLADKTTGKNIMWATDAYAHLGPAYERNAHITPSLVTGANSDVIKTRARKEREQQTARTRKRAEVFTPLRICRRMIDDVDAEWFGHAVPEGAPMPFEPGSPRSRKARTWRNYADSRRLEPACGEAPYLVSRYDAETGEHIPVGERTGILDRKLRAVSDNAENEKEWLKWALRACQATYGYEFCGDNLLIARVNALMSFAEHMEHRWGRKPAHKELRKMVNVIVWNIWQMDGLTDRIPYKKPDEGTQMSLLSLLGEDAPAPASEQPLCRVKNWRLSSSGKSCELRAQKTAYIKGKEQPVLKFDYIIGNPPYQADNENNGRKPPIYHEFMDACYEIGNVVELITPARFLFDAGQTPKAWNQKMLNDEHLKVMMYEQDSTKIFVNTDIKGGVAVTLRDKSKQFGAIKMFTALPELNNILNKVLQQHTGEFVNSIISNRGMYRFTDDYFKDYPQMAERIADGTGNMLTSKTFDLMPEAFSETAPNSDEYIGIYGRVSNERVHRYIKRAYIVPNEYIDTFNVFVPEANGSGAIGEVLSTPVIGRPVIGHTDTFLSIGRFKTEEEAEACLKYIKSKFARALLGILKVTQHNPPATWKYVPLQDFTASSDIDWSKSVAEIDRQLYKKYGLDQAEIDFIESHVKEMN